MLEYPASMKFNSRRSTVVSKNGMVSTSQPLAAAAGLEILRQGGNAADAALRHRGCPECHRANFHWSGRRLLCLVLRRQNQTGACTQWFRTTPRVH